MKKIKRFQFHKFIQNIILTALFLSFISLINAQNRDLIKTDSLQIEKIIDDSLYYEADSLKYYVNLEKILLIANAQINYGSSNISSDSMMIDFNKEQALAMGRILMQDNDQVILGSRVYYDINTETGFIIEGASKFELGFCYGRLMRKISDKIFDVDDGKFTTCDAKEPHFDIRAHQMRIYRDNMVVGKPVIFYVNEFPIMGLPFAAFSIKRGRESGILVPEPGYNPTDGKYLKNLAFYYVINDNADMTWTNDFTELTGWKTEFKLPYKKRYSYTGNLNALLKKRMSNLRTYSYDWSFSHNHQQEFYDKSVFYMNLDFASSRSVWNTDTDVDKRLQQSITSSISYRKPLLNSTIYASSAYTEDLITNQKGITLPTISYSLPSKPVYELFPLDMEALKDKNHWWKNFYYSWQSYATHTGTIKEKSPSFSDLFFESSRDTLGNFLNEHHAGLRQNVGLSWNNNFFGWLKVNQSISLTDIIIDRDINNKKLAHGYAYTTNSSMAFSLYGVARYDKSKLVAIRHILTPSISYSWAPDFSKENNDLYSFSGVSVSHSKRARSMSFALEQKWQAKIKGELENQYIRLNDLVLWRSSSSLDLERKIKPWNNINHSLALNTGSYDGIIKISSVQSFEAIQNPYDFNIKSWRLALGLSFSGDADYKDYFPLEKNEFVTRKFFDQADTVSVQDQIIESISELENLQKPGTWKFSSSFDYQKNRILKTTDSSLRNSSNFKITNNWSLNYTNYISIKDKRLISQSINLVRDLHCWKLTFAYSKSANFWDYRIVLYNIKIPDSLKLETSDHR